jgi:triacylglycerol lipase
MPLTNSQAVPYGLLAMYAEDTFAASPTNRKTPPPDPRIAAAGWSIQALAMARDVVIPEVGAKHQRMSVDHVNDPIYYGYMARSTADANIWVVSVRGTQELVEWVIDAEFALRYRAGTSGPMVEQGFSDIYDTMALADSNGRILNANAAKGIADLVGANGRVTVVGHSLGSALATYLSYDIAQFRGDWLSACLFASPRTGDAAWTAAYDARVKNYNLYNYILDIVTHVPTGLGYSALPRATRLEPAHADAGVTVELGCNHHVVCYCAMLDYNKTVACAPIPPPKIDKNECDCIRGNSTAVTTEARVLAEIVEKLGDGNDLVRELTKIIHRA